jgi:flagellar hook protein FlgE
VDLATELTDMIEAQEAYQADTKVVSTTQTALQSLVQMQ